MTEATGRPAPRSIRLRFRVEREGVALVAAERVDMISPPAPGPAPVAAENGGSWFELRDESDRTLAHRVVSDHLTGSVEVFSPDGGIRREFGPVPGSVFEVLLPDEPDASQVVLIGQPPAVDRDRRASREVGRFRLPL